MKGSADEEHLVKALDVTTKCMSEADTAIVVSGRNDLFYKDAKKAAMAFKPRVGMRELELSPSEDAVLGFIRADQSSVGTVDLRDKYLQFVKNAGVLKSKKGVPRRFVGGNTAFRAMTGIPTIPKAEMLTLSAKERDAIFRGVQGTEKWKGKKDVDADEDAEDAQPEAQPDGDDDVKVVDPSSDVPLFTMELHPRVHHLVEFLLEPICLGHALVFPMKTITRTLVMCVCAAAFLRACPRAVIFPGVRPDALGGTCACADRFHAGLGDHDPRCACALH
jgi:hypothetical protein